MLLLFAAVRFGIGSPANVAWTPYDPAGREPCVYWKLQVATPAPFVADEHCTSPPNLKATVSPEIGAFVRALVKVAVKVICWSRAVSTPDGDTLFNTRFVGVKHEPTVTVAELKTSAKSLPVPPSACWLTATAQV